MVSTNNELSTEKKLNNLEYFPMNNNENFNRDEMRRIRRQRQQQHLQQQYQIRQIKKELKENKSTGSKILNFLKKFIENDGENQTQTLKVKMNFVY
ncbi:hypothetical protein DDB_G0288213 [Dictyostelium discoideum AX4]|uniref:Uncharacterized protein DDB_G0288213 n=1 Tax=Dictyostelium discoideum TaxID=44689 RepID=Y7835_DICDI|nr:hypothetical protein DDB_G0288213 [Dictyostelium discoideum AX4]Q54J90.1 RecName: Full=Uncharacterized protein DDB_G0288213 [Dictyostelium discoideum]EAL63337.1 hypothetical protein DDB_G0288213 [Dictyostelium discoideum AX4]|eukprot:XP_636846.1 hypothetical protein DDB_G0288213 [Dictyostelium discoideum AX4]